MSAETCRYRLGRKLRMQRGLDAVRSLQFEKLIVKAKDQQRRCPMSDEILLVAVSWVSGWIANQFSTIVGSEVIRHGFVAREADLVCRPD